MVWIETYSAIDSPHCTVGIQHETTSFDIIFQQSLQSDVEKSNSETLQNSSEMKVGQQWIQIKKKALNTEKTSFEIIFQQSLQSDVEKSNLETL